MTIYIQNGQTKQPILIVCFAVCNHSSEINALCYEFAGASTGGSGRNLRPNWARGKRTTP